MSPRPGRDLPCGRLPRPALRWLLLVPLMMLPILGAEGQGTRGSDPPSSPPPPPQPRPAGQTDGRCFHFSLRVATNSSDYYYTCCDKVGGDTARTDEEIKIPTFNYDCNPFRLDGAELSPTQQHFNCDGREKAEKLCNKRWGWLSTDDCWVWSSCFEDACKLEAKVAELRCGDGRCDADESPASCPLDCCPFENPEICVVKNSTCPRRCCGETACCDTLRGVTAPSSDTFWLVLGIVAGSVLLLILLCCCCCCCCCKKLYNSMFSHHKKRRHSFIVSGAGVH